MQPRNYPEDADPSFAATLRRFEKLTLEEQLPLLAFFLREELKVNRSAVASSRQPIRPAAAHARVTHPSAPSTAPPDSPTALPASPPGDAGSSAEPLTPVTASVSASTPAKLQVIESALLEDLSGAANPRPRRKKPRITPPGTAAATRPRPLSIAATMAVCFPLALALMLWRRPPADPMPAIQWSPVQPAFAGADELTRNRPLARSSPSQPADSSQPVSTLARGQAPASQVNAIARGGDPKAMPVTLYFRRRGFHSDPYDRRKINWYMEGRLTNLSDVPMNIEVRAESTGALGASQIQIDVEPHNERDFGVDDGLEMHPGDKVTLMSAPYSDLVVGGVH